MGYIKIQELQNVRSRYLFHESNIAGSALISSAELEVADVADFIRKTNWMLKTKSFEGL